MATAGVGEINVSCSYTFVAYEEIEDYRILTFSNVDERVIKAAAATEKPIAVSQTAQEVHRTNTYAAGYTVDAAVSGVCFIEMSGSGLRGNTIVATTDGKGTKFTLNSADQWAIGHAMRNWDDGDIIPVLIDRCFIGNVDASS